MDKPVAWELIFFKYATGPAIWPEVISYWNNWSGYGQMNWTLFVHVGR